VSIGVSASCPGDWNADFFDYSARAECDKVAALNALNKLQQ